MKRALSLLAWVVLSLFVSLIAAQCQDYWDGRAPFCKGGPCRPGYYQAATSKTGSGSRCWSGKKVLCRCGFGGSESGQCLAPQPFCWGFVKLCIDGCSTWVCGGCFGLGTSWFLDIFKRSMDPFPRLSREEVLAAVDQMDLQQKREGLFYLKVKSAYCDPPEIVDATIRNMTATLFDGLYLIDPVASYDNWKEGPDLWAWRLDNRTDENEPQNGGGCNGSPCHGNTEQCDPHPPNNKCDITTSCIQTGQSGGHYCACRAGYKADALDDDISVHHRASFSGQEYRVFVKPGIKCDTLCKWDSLGPINCGEVKVLSN